MDRYYTPGIEEFYYGFRYQCQLEGGSGEWIDKVVLLDSLLDLIRLIQQERIRVKCLDQADIESFGWKIDHIHHSSGHIIYYSVLGSDNQYELVFNPKINSVRIDLLFQGIVLNKSELKKILEKINIIQKEC